MRELCGGPGLAPETLTQVGRLCAFGWQHLDRHLTIERRFASQVNRPHTAAAKQPLDTESPLYRRLQALAKAVGRRRVGAERTAALRAKARTGGSWTVTARAGQDAQSTAAGTSLHRTIVVC